MKVVIQRSKDSHVEINNKVYGKISKGMVVLVGFEVGDTEEDIDYIVKKIVNLRIFTDEKGIMNKNIQEVSGAILSISQFTLAAITKNGNRPSYIKAMNGHDALLLYDKFNQKLQEFVTVQTGIFGADMLVTINNDGPVTILIDSKNK